MRHHIATKVTRDGCDSEIIIVHAVYHYRNPRETYKYTQFQSLSQFSIMSAQLLLHDNK